MNIADAMQRRGPLAPDHSVLPTLVLNARGHIASAPANVRNIYLLDNRKKGRVRYNSFAHHVTMDGQRLDDTWEMRESLWLADVYGMSVKPKEVGEVLRFIGQSDIYHPVQEYLAALPAWEGKTSIDSLFTKYFGAEDGGAIRSYGRKMMIGAVARAMMPGCKLDNMVILSGPQGAGKSRGVRALAPTWFSDAPLQIGDRDAVLALHNVWLYEVAELDSFRGRAAQKIKAFLSTQSDRYRGVYSRHYTMSHRSCIFVGTTNEERFLRDSTGNRRFWPVQIGAKVDVDGIERDRAQLWAEAYQAYLKQEQWHLTDDEMKDLLRDQEVHIEIDPWTYPVLDFMESPKQLLTPPRMDEILEAVGVEHGRQDKRAMLRVSDILTQHGYRSRQTRRPNGKRPKCWSKA